MNDIFIAPQESRNRLGTGNYRGHGTYDRPLYGDFDAIMDDKSKPGIRMNLLCGEFFTRGKYESRSFLKEHMTVCGQGMDHTRLSVVNFDRDNQFGIFFSGPENDYVHVQDLTIDANGDNAWDKKSTSVVLKGSHCSIRRVRALGSSGKIGARLGEGYESFSLYVSNPGKVGSIIEDCIVEDCRGDYCNGLNVGGGSAVLRNNTVKLPNIAASDRDGPQIHMSGINLMHSTGALVDGNEIYGGTEAIYNDTGVLKNATIVNNKFVGGWRGVYVENNGSDSCIDTVDFSHNLIDLHEDNQWNDSRKTWGTGLSFWNRTRSKVWNNINLTNNTIRTIDNKPGKIRFAQFVSEHVDPGIKGIIISGNTVEKEAHLRFVKTSGEQVYQNWDLEGNPYSAS